MAQSFITQSGQILVEPGTYVDVSVKNDQAGTPTAGVVTIIGESDAGPDFTQEANLDQNAFGPDALASVVSKYGSGRIVDAFRALISAASDPAITGAVSQIKIVKTNKSEKSSAQLDRNGFGEYATFKAKRAGADGNQIKYRSEVLAAEVAPTTNEFAYTPHFDNSNPVIADLRANGNSAISPSISSGSQGSSVVAAFSSVAKGILATGMIQSLPITGAGTISCTPVGSPSLGVLAVTIPNDVSGLVSVGDSAVIPSASFLFGASGVSAIVGTASANAGSYLVTSVSAGTSSVITLKRINAPSGTPAITSASGSISGDFKDIIVYSKGQIYNLTGQNRQSNVGLAGSYTVVVASATDITVTAPDPFPAQPKAGDIIQMASNMLDSLSSPILMAGFYSVTSASEQAITISRLSNGTAGPGGTSVAYSTIVAGAEPFNVLKPTIDGLGKTLMVDGDVSSIFKDPSTGSALPISNSLISSASEYINKTTISRGTQTNSYKVGGDIICSFGCTQNAATMVVSDSKIDFKISGVTQFSVDFKDIKTLQDLVDFVNSQNTFSASLSNPRFAFQSLDKLDRGTFGISAAAGMKPGKIKEDAYAFSIAINSDPLVSASLPTQSGLPETVPSDTFLTGGSKAGSSSADFAAAVDACQLVDTNFIVPLLSKDASDDIATGDTESTSTYVVDAVNSLIKDHCIQMSALKARKNRIGMVSKSGAYADQKTAAGQMSSFRIGMAFQDVKTLASDGTIKQYQPWMAAIIAVGMQAAAGYRGIVKKFANVSGVVKPENDWDSNRQSDREDALKAGLIPLERVRTGGFRWISDQLTYSADANFVYNSLQAVYVSDLIVYSLIEAFDRAIIGQSVAEVTAQGALSFLEGQMFNFLRLRWIAASDDAPKGFKNAVVKLNGPALTISVECKLAGLIYFCPISLTLSEVSQTASQ